MTVALRVTLIVASILTLVFIARKVRSSQVKLLIKSFSFTMRISHADTKIRELTQQLAIDKYERYNNDKEEKKVQ